jgi:hypothetical protein
MRYTSSRALFGLPLYDVVLPGPGPAGAPQRRAVARGWLAIGPVAAGLISFGGLSIGGISLGGLAIGFFPVGGLTAGAIAFGGFAIGYWALGGAAIAANAALGGVAAAPTYALGGAAFAEHANDPTAREFFSSGFVWPALRSLARHSNWALALLVCLLVLPFLAKKRPKA